MRKKSTKKSAVKETVVKQMIVLQGPPCSGKSTWAESFMVDHKEEKWMLVNRDKIRIEVGGGQYTMDHEDEVTERLVQLMETASEDGYNIINDNTNLNPYYLDQLVQWASEHGYEITYQKFYVPYKEAVKRSKARRNEGGIYVPREVIKRFYIKYFEPVFRSELTDDKIIDCEHSNQAGAGKQLAVISDLDGTIALHNGRDPFEWDRLETDIVDQRLQLTLIGLQRTGAQIIFLTGRPERVRQQTINWLNRYFDRDSYKLYMRADNDKTKGNEFKRGVYLTEIAPNYNVLGVFEDSQKCIDMWREEGVLCYAVASNDY